ncbi:MAG TPA: sigma-70 family RNA polymerase sigma factor [Vicinamibacterales bacterium]|nr:sigma-70 family RNA polymerase sigma factor [Vicinamibacterales bacterium]
MFKSELDQELIGRLQRRDKDAADQLARIYGPMIHQLAFRYMKSWEDAEEIAQDVMMKVVRRIDAFRGDSALSSWIYRITFNTAMSRLRNSKYSRPLEVLQSDLGKDAAAREPFEVPDWSGLGDEAVMRAELRRALSQALTELPDVYRVPVVLRDIQGLSTEEASQVLQVKTQTLKSRLHRGRMMLRERLGEFSGGLTLHRQAA